jgi:hypothetical protein
MKMRSNLKPGDLVQLLYELWAFPVEIQIQLDELAKIIVSSADNDARKVSWADYQTFSAKHKCSFSSGTIGTIVDKPPNSEHYHVLIAGRNYAIKYGLTGKINDRYQEK